jgi:hypothetical protein
MKTKVYTYKDKLIPNLWYAYIKPDGSGRFVAKGNTKKEALKNLQDITNDITKKYSEASENIANNNIENINTNLYEPNDYYSNAFYMHEDECMWNNTRMILIIPEHNSRKSYKLLGHDPDRCDWWHNKKELDDSNYKYTRYSNLHQNIPVQNPYWI